MTGDARSVAFTPTLDDALSAQRLAIGGATLRYGLAGAAVVAAVTYAMATSGALPTAAVLAFTALPTAGYGAVMVLLWRLRFPRLVARRFRQQAAMSHACRVSWDEDGLLTETERSRALMCWADYVKRRENDAVILLYETDASFQLLPKRAFDAGRLASIRPFLDSVPAGRRRAIPRP